MVPPNGVSFARSGSTWIHWKSSVASANALTRSWVISYAALSSRSLTILARSSSGPVIVSIAGAYPRGPRRRSDDVQARDGLQRQLRVAAVLGVALGGVGRGEQQLGGRAVVGMDRRTHRRGERAAQAVDRRQRAADARDELGDV